MKLPKWDSPYEIVEGIFKAQQKILTGYKANPKTDLQKFREANRPKHVAISLTGEPTLYEHIGELISVLKNKGLTTFLVSNGTLPKKLSRLTHEPTQLYVSVCAPNEKVFRHVCRPQIPHAWKLLNETLSSLHSFSCPTVIRSTLVKKQNMDNVEGYAKIISKAEPTYVEVKAYMHVGFSGLRLGFDSMPKHKEICEFAVKLAQETSYKILDDSPDSRVVLLSKKDKPIKFIMS